MTKILPFDYQCLQVKKIQLKSWTFQKRDLKKVISIKFVSSIFVESKTVIQGLTHHYHFRFLTLKHNFMLILILMFHIVKVRIKITFTSKDFKEYNRDTNYNPSNVIVFILSAYF